MSNHFRSAQRGATLVIGMIMLVLVTLFVLAAINMSTLNLRIMGNEQSRNESIAAAQQAIEQVASTDFTTNPQSPSTVPVDINGDGTTDYTVAVATPTCLNSVPVKQSALKPVNPNGTINQNDFQCIVGGPSRTPGVAGSAGTGNSICANSQWELNATRDGRRSVGDGDGGSPGRGETRPDGYSVLTGYRTIGERSPWRSTKGSIDMKTTTIRMAKATRAIGTLAFITALAVALPAVGARERHRHFRRHGRQCCAEHSDHRRQHVEQRRGLHVYVPVYRRARELAEQQPSRHGVLRAVRRQSTRSRRSPRSSAS